MPHIWTSLDALGLPLRFASVFETGLASRARMARRFQAELTDFQNSLRAETGAVQFVPQTPEMLRIKVLTLPNCCMRWQSE